MSQVNNPTGIPKVRPNDFKGYEHTVYLSQVEDFMRQVYENLTGINQMRVYTVADLPSASAFDPTTGDCAFVYVSDESGGAVPAFSDGTNWRRFTDRAIVS